MEQLPDRTGLGKLISVVVVIVGLLAGIVQILDFALPPKPTVVTYSPTPAPQIATPTPAPIPDLSPTPVPDPSQIVYRTGSGDRYHRAGCRHVKGKAIELTLAAAKERGLTPCKTCRPPS